MKLKICHLYPDVLNLSGDAGNLLCLQRRLQWRGIECEITRLPVGATADFTQFDLFYMGSGQEFEQQIVLDDLKGGKDKEIIAAVEDEKVFLCVGGGFELMGQYRKNLDETQTDFIGAINTYTLASTERHTGNFMYRRVDDFTGSIVVGYESHCGKTYLEGGVKPLGEMMSGFGNNGEDRTEGGRYKKVYGTYCLGPMLPKNPEFADSLLHTALLRSNPNIILEPLFDFLETRAHDYMRDRLTAK